ncbi:unnamed protein product [Urochloa humidicola]
MAGLLTSAATIPPLVAAALAMATTVILLQLSAAARPPLSAPAAVALPGCNSTCGDVEVPYPFGFGPAHCYWPGFNLTCNTSGPGRPRLLLGDGTLRVTEISIKNATVRVMSNVGLVVNDTTDSLTSDNWSNYTFGSGFGDYGYKLSAYRNVLVVVGCNVVVSLQSGHKQEGIGAYTINVCVSFCQSDAISIFDLSPGLCEGCCMSRLLGNDTALPIALQIRSLYSATDDGVQVYFVEEGHMGSILNHDRDERPLILSWGLTRGPLPPPESYECADDIRRKVCKSEHSSCSTATRAYICQCKDGFYGNPYLAGGCQS